VAPIQLGGDPKLKRQHHGVDPASRPSPRAPSRPAVGLLAGLILGWIGVGFAVLAVIGIVLAAVAFTRSSGGSTHVTPG
jgi:hypothetical protein